ncbi:uncharacterized protein LOC143290770 [Babylonia areolata]|uniref:uncharacterized protein LOC143290770 n=1 Tax=Babylonia areolata TaxID=304850 RepID=UPI003FD22DBC
MSGEKLASPQAAGDEGQEDGSTKTAESNAGEGSDQEAGSKPSHSAVQVITRFMCKFCGRQFIRRADMDAHALLHDDERPPLTCGVCGKIYNTRSKLQRHVRVHSGERPFPCNVCGKRFPRSDHVKQHMRVHSKLSGELLVTGTPLGLTHKSHCRLCGVKFEDRSELGKHLLSHGFNKLYSCIYCGEVFESNDKLKKHKQAHEARLEEFLPVLSVPDPSMSSKNTTPFSKNACKRKKPGRPKGSKTVNKRRKDLSRLGFSKFKITRRSGSESWQTVAPVLKTEEAESADQSASTSDHPMPILERILMDSRPSIVKSERDTEGDHSDSGNKSESSDIPQMSISACYSLAEGQDNSDIPDIEEIRASTLLDGNNMIMLPSGRDLREEEDEEEDSSNAAEGEERETEEGVAPEVSQASSVCAVPATRSVADSEARTTQTSLIRPTVLPATATATLMTLQQHVNPQTALAACSSSCAAGVTPTPSTTAITTRPTISLLPNVLAFRTHPLLPAPALNLAPHAVQPTVGGGLYNGAGRLYNPLTNFPPTASSPAAAVLSLPGLESFPPGRKMMRCQHCCIWFEDSALGLLHQSLHSADDTDPFTCKKCLKRLGNRLEFTAHIIWHLDPTMEDSSAV